MMNLVDRASELVGEMRAAIANAPVTIDDEAERGSTRRLPASINPGHHPEMHDAPHNTEVVRHSRGQLGRQRYRIQYAGKLKTPIPNLSDTRVFYYMVIPEGSSMRAIHEGGFYATANGNRVRRHWWYKTGRVMVGQVAEALARAPARGQPTARSPLARLSNPPPAPRDAQADTDEDRSNEFYARARFQVRLTPTREARHQNAARNYLSAVDYALRARVAVPAPPAGLELSFVEAAAESMQDPVAPYLLREVRQVFQAHSVQPSPPNPRRTALGAGAARAVQSSQLPPADAPDAASFGLCPIAAATNESEREKLTSCAICLDEEKPRVALFAPCGHLAACLSCYHAACAADARNARTCPICKVEGKPVLLRLA